MPRFLVVAHRTLGGTHLFDHLRQLVQDDSSCEFHVLVPRYHPRDKVWSDGTTQALADEHLDEMLEAMKNVVEGSTGEVGRSNPVDAIRETLEREGVNSFAGIILSTLPRRSSLWWRSDVPGRVNSQFPALPLTHLVPQDVVTT
jgi:hypothetical protein